LLLLQSRSDAISNIYFGDETDGDRSYIRVKMSDGAADYMAFGVAAAERMRIAVDGRVGIGETVPATRLHVVQEDAVTNTSIDLLRLGHNSTGLTAAGFGAGLNFTLESTTTVDMPAASVIATWADATHATRASRLTLYAFDSANAREGIRIQASGTAPMLGFFGVAAAVRPGAFTQTYATSSHTHSNITAVDPGAYLTGAFGYSAAATALAIHTEVIALRADIVNIKNVITGIIDDLQTLGLLQ
jgi:hypothetical protein